MECYQDKSEGNGELVHLNGGYGTEVVLIKRISNPEHLPDNLFH